MVRGEEQQVAPLPPRGFLPDAEGCRVSRLKAWFEGLGSDNETDPFIYQQLRRRCGCPKCDVELCELLFVNMGTLGFDAEGDASLFSVVQTKRTEVQQRELESAGTHGFSQKAEVDTLTVEAVRETGRDAAPDPGRPPTIEEEDETEVRAEEEEGMNWPEPPPPQHYDPVDGSEQRELRDAPVMAAAAPTDTSPPGAPAKPQDRPGPRCLNPDPVARLVGPANEVPVVVNGMWRLPALLDTGAQITALTEQAANHMGLRISPLKGVNLKVESITGDYVNPTGMTEFWIQRPDLPGEEWPCAAIVVPETKYTKRVPLILGTNTLDGLMTELTKSETKLQGAWATVQNARVMAAQQEQEAKEEEKKRGQRREFALQDVDSKVRLTEAITLKPNETLVVKARVRIRNNNQGVNVIVEPAEFQKVAVNRAYGYLKAGSQTLRLVVQNRNDTSTYLARGLVFGHCIPGNKFPDRVTLDDLCGNTVEMDLDEDNDISEEEEDDQSTDHQDEESSGSEYESAQDCTPSPPKFSKSLTGLADQVMKNREKALGDARGNFWGPAIYQIFAAAEVLGPRAVEASPGVTKVLGEAESRAGDKADGTPSKAAPEEAAPQPVKTPWWGPHLGDLYDKHKELFGKLNMGKMAEATPQQQKKAVELFKEFDPLFAKHKKDLGKTSVIKHTITLTDPRPVRQPHRRIPPHLVPMVKQELQDMLDVGAIQPSESPWAHPVVIAKKKDGSMRFCIDLRKLNAVTVRDAHSLPRIEETLDQLRGALWFSALDLQSGYWQVEMDAKSREYTAFTCGPLGFFECVRMPFGASNAPATFQRLMQSVLGDLHLQFVIIYLDDIIVYSGTLEDHIEHLRSVFGRLLKAGLKLKPKKCAFFQTETSYLGHIIGRDGVRTDPSKVDQVRDWPRPTNVKQLRAFLGFAGYYRKFIKHFSQVAFPLLEELKGSPRPSTPVTWNDEKEHAFQELKTRCTEAPVLAYANFEQPFEVHTDASGRGLGATLNQMSDGAMRPIAYASRALNAAEKNYDTHKLEFLALKWAITEKFHDYLQYGGSFVVKTDNNPLTYILTTAKLDATGQRWVAQLAQFNMKLVYRAGKLNAAADALSRREWTEPATMQEICQSAVQAIVARVSMTDPAPPPFETYSANPIQALEKASEDVQRAWADPKSWDWAKEQGDEEQLAVVREAVQAGQRWADLTAEQRNVVKPWGRCWGRLVVHDGVLYSLTRDDTRDLEFRRLVLPAKFHKRALQTCHDEMGHFALERVLALVRDRFFWLGWRQSVQEYVKACSACRNFKTRPEKAPQQPYITCAPLELVHLDILKMDKCKGNVEKILVCTDHFSSYAQAYPIKGETAPVVATAFCNNWVRYFGLPDRIVTDQGRNFMGNLMTELWRLCGVTKSRTTPYHPQTNGSCERFNRTLISMLGTLDPEKKRDWKEELTALTFAYNSTKSSMHGYSPYELLFNRQPKLPLDYEFGVGPLPGVTPFEPKTAYVRHLRQRLLWAHERALAAITRRKWRAKKNYDRRATPSQLQVGDWVLVRQCHFDTTHKIQNFWEADEYEVVKVPTEGMPVYTVQAVGGGRLRTLHRDLLLPLVRKEWLDASDEVVNEPDEVEDHGGGGVVPVPPDRQSTGSRSSSADAPSPRKVVTRASARLKERKATPTPKPCSPARRLRPRRNGRAVVAEGQDVYTHFEVEGQQTLAENPALEPRGVRASTPTN